MVTYYFDIQTGAGLIRDPIGTELPDDATAHAHACAVARELMRHQESKSRHWRLRVRRECGEFCFDLLFATMDQTMEVLEASVRRSVERVSGNVANLSEAIGDLRLTLGQMKATMAKTDARIHLAAVDGNRV
jgi:Domain of unknown function (DUF6894)